MSWYYPAGSSSAGGSGTVSSVGLSVLPASVLSVSGSPVTSSGDIALTIASGGATSNGYIASGDYNLFNTRVLEWTVFIPTTDVTTGDGKVYFVVPPCYANKNIVSIHGLVITAGVTGTTDVQIARIRAGSPVDVLSTKLTIDSGETGSDTALTPAVINTSNDDLASYDILRVDVDATSTTKAKGLIVTMEIR